MSGALSVAELGHYALVLALALTLIQSTVPLVGLYRGDARLAAVAPSTAVAAFGCIAIAFAALVFACAASGLEPAAAQDYPSRTIKLILPQPAGGAVDLIARSRGERLAEQMSQPVIVENMPGANGSLAGAAVARAPPDGYTPIVAGGTKPVVNPSH